MVAARVAACGRPKPENTGFLSPNSIYSEYFAGGVLVLSEVGLVHTHSSVMGEQMDRWRWTCLGVKRSRRGRGVIPFL